MIMEVVLDPTDELVTHFRIYPSSPIWGCRRGFSPSPQWGGLPSSFVSKGLGSTPSRTSSLAGPVQDRSLKPLCPQNNPPFPCSAGLPQKRVLGPSHRLESETLVTPGCLFHRGNSKYHYYGIRLKPDSPLNRLQEDTQYMAMRQQPLHQKPRWVASAGPS